MPEDVNKGFSLLNVDTKVVVKLYDDLASPGMKKVGAALSTVLDLSNTIIWPIKWANERTRIYFENNLNKYRESLENIPEENICEVPTEIVIPILERFKYLTNEDLSNAFVKLLKTASSTETISLAHPGFISIIDRLSPDEAKILAYYKKAAEIPFLIVGWLSDSKMAQITVVDKETFINKYVDLNFKENIDLYFDNLTSLGLISQYIGYYEKDENEYKELMETFKDLLENTRPQHVNVDNEEEFLKETRGMYVITHLGKLFIQTCITNK